jgi:hypothetical protein
VVEGIAAIAVVFILFTVLTQGAAALIAHRGAESAAAAAAARVAIVPASAREEAGRLERAVAATVPGADRIEGSVSIGHDLVTALVRFEFVPPGPMFRSFDMEVTASAPLVVEP